MPFEPKIDPQKSEEQNGKTDDGHNGRPAPAPADAQAHVEHGGVKNPGDARPYLLGIPTPEPTPDGLGINESADQTKGQQGEADDNAGLGGSIEHIQRRSAPEEKSRIFGFYGTFLQQIEDPDAAGQCEGRIADKDRHHVRDQPEVVKDTLFLSGRVRHLGDSDHDQRNQRGGVNPQNF